MKYIFNADDFGRTQTVNEAIAAGFQNGCLDRTTVMVNMPFFEEAVALAKEYNFQDKVGLHINITSGKPLTRDILECSRFCHEDGNFNGTIFKNKKMLFFLSRQEKKALYGEILAQVDAFMQAGFSLRHADSHGHVHTFPSMLGLVIKALREESFTSLRLSANLHGSKARRFYKALLNWRIRRFNHCEKAQCKYFDSLGSVRKKKRWLQGRNSVCEVMLHPNIWDGDMQIGESFHFSDINNL